MQDRNHHTDNTDNTVNTDRLSMYCKPGDGGDKEMWETDGVKSRGDRGHLVAMKVQGQIHEWISEMHRLFS